jgi:hypothetical protein
MAIPGLMAQSVFGLVAFGLIILITVAVRLEDE